MLIAMSTGNYTRTDNVFISSTLIERLTTCTTVPEDQPAKRNHFPIDTTLELKVHTAEKTQKFNFHKTNWKKFKELLEGKLEEAIPHATPHSHQHFVGYIYASYPRYKSNILQNLFKSFKLLSKHSKYSKIFFLIFLYFYSHLFECPIIFLPYL